MPDFVQSAIEAPILIKAFVGFALFVVAYILWAFVFTSKAAPKGKHVVRYDREGAEPLHVDIHRGAAIFASSGSGKTTSGFVPIFKAARQNRLSMLNYDYKDFELTELLNNVYRGSDIPVYTVSPTRPELSHRCNPIHSTYLNGFDDINTLAEVTIDNLGTPTKGDGAIWSRAARSALAGIMCRLKEDYPEHCHLPMATSIILGKEPMQLIDFIKRNENASLLGKTFLDSASSDRTLSSVSFTLSDAFTMIISPEMFYVFSGNDVDLAINKKPCVLNIVNHPKRYKPFTPMLALTMVSSMLQMSERGRNESIVLIDEGSTVKINEFQRYPATLRSFGVGTVWSLQDKVQGKLLYDDDVVKAILTNLGVKLFGKANDPDTAKYYEKFFDIVEVEQISTSKAQGAFANGDNRVNISTREKTEFKAQDFYRLEPGNFFVFDERGESYKTKFKLIECEPVPSKIVNNITKTELEVNFKDIRDRGKSLV